MKDIYKLFKYKWINNTYNLVDNIDHSKNQHTKNEQHLKKNVKNINSKIWISTNFILGSTMIN